MQQGFKGFQVSCFNFLGFRVYGLGVRRAVGPTTAAMMWVRSRVGAGREGDDEDDDDDDDDEVNIPFPVLPFPTPPAPLQPAL